MHQGRMETADAWRSFQQRHPNSAFQFDRCACFPVPTWHRPGRGAQRRGWEERSHAQHREHGEHRTFPVVSTVAG